MKPFRSITGIFKRHAVPMSINLLGLVTALTAFIIIMSHVEFERNYDRSYPTSGRIFRVDCPGNEETFRSILPNAFARDVINSSAHIEAGTMLMPYLGELLFFTGNGGEGNGSDGNGGAGNGNKIGYRLSCDLVQPAFIEVFGVNIIKGDSSSLTVPGKAIIPESMAEMLFRGDATGKVLETEPSYFFPDGKVAIGAVYEDFPANSNLRNSIYFAIDERTTPYTYGAANFICYLLLDSPESAKSVEEEFNSTFDFSQSWMSPIELIPMEDIYFMGQGGDGTVFYSGNRNTTILLTAIAILVLLSGVLNFANFFTSLAPVRIRDINTRKVAGASTASLRASLTCESLIISIAALIVSFFLAGWLSEALAAGGLLNGIFSIQSTEIILTVTAITIAAGIAAGLYPSWYATSYPPALVLKGDFGLSRGGRTFRNIMSGIQYTVAFVTLIFMTFVLLQNRHIRNADLGFDTDMTAVADVSSPIALRYDFIKTEAASYPSIEGVTFSTDKIGSRDTYSTQGIEYEGQEISCLMISVKDDFFSTLGIGIIEGRDFNTTDASSGGVIVSKYFKDMYGISAGDIIMGNIPVTGICDNVKFSSARESNKPIIFMPISDENMMWYPMGTMYFRLKSGSDAIKAASEIESLLKKAAPDEPVEIEFYDTILNNLYQSELRTGKLVAIFSIIAIILALGGVVGLVLFDTQYRKKETSVRKIFGASVGKILEKANTGYALIVLVCFIIACPIAVLVTSRWLQNFTDRIPLYPWVFVLALAVMAAATSLIVTGVFYRRATANPQEGLN